MWSNFRVPDRKASSTGWRPNKISIFSSLDALGVEYGTGDKPGSLCPPRLPERRRSIQVSVRKPFLISLQAGGLAWAKEPRLVLAVQLKK
jgi:hypothetical protein